MRGGNTPLLQKYPEILDTLLKANEPGVGFSPVEEPGNVTASKYWQAIKGATIIPEAVQRVTLKKEAQEGCRMGGRKRDQKDNCGIEINPHSLRLPFYAKTGLLIDSSHDIHTVRDRVFVCPEAATMTRTAVQCNPGREGPQEIDDVIAVAGLWSILTRSVGSGR